MIAFIHKNLAHVLFALLLISRLGDIISTLIATPDLKLESNLLAKKLGKPFVFATVLISFVAYYDTSIAVMMLIPFLFVSFSNIGKIWFLKSFGEENYRDFLINKIKEKGIKGIILQNLASAFFVCLIGFSIFIFYSTTDTWGYWIACGFFTFGFILLFWGTINTFTLYFRVKHGKLGKQQDS
jgi:hypothetical protein